MSYTAQQELFKKYSLSPEQIEIFCTVRKSVPVEDFSDIHLLMCVCSKKTVEKTLKLAKNCIKLVKDNKLLDIKVEDFPKLYQENAYMKSLLDSEVIFYSDKIRTVEDYGVMMMDYGAFVKTKKVEERTYLMKVFFKVFEQFLLENPNNVTKGVYFIADLSGFSLMNFDIHIEKLVAELFQGFPVRLKKMIMFDPPWYIWLLFNLLRPFYSKKMWERIVMCRKSDLTKYIGTESLIKSWGGNYDFKYADFVSKYGISGYVSNKSRKSKVESKDEVISKLKEEYKISDSEIKEQMDINEKK